MPPKGQGSPQKGQGFPPKGQGLPPKVKGKAERLPPKDISHLAEAPGPERAAAVKSAMRMMKDLGCQVYRADIAWRFIEQSRGEFKWARADWVIEALRSTEGGGCRLIAMPGYQPLWLPAEFAAKRSGLEAYGRWVQAVVARYAKQVDYWEVWNEPMVFWLRHPNHKPAKDQPPLSETQRPGNRASCDVVL